VIPQPVDGKLRDEIVEMNVDSVMDSATSAVAIEATSAQVRMKSATSEATDAKSGSGFASEARFLTLPNGALWYQLGASTLFIREDYDYIYDEWRADGCHAIAILGTAGIGMSVMHGYWMFRYLQDLQQGNRARPASYPLVTVRLLRESVWGPLTDLLVTVDLHSRQVNVLDVRRTGQPVGCVNLCLIDGYKETHPGDGS